MKTRHAQLRAGLRRLLAAVAGSLLLCLPVAASAQDIYSMADQLNQLQREVADLQRQVFAGGGSAGSAVGGGNAAASQEVRLQQMDDQIRSLTGQVEQLSYKLQQIATKLDKLAGDVDYRLNALEQGGGTPGPAASAENPPQVTAPAGGGAATPPGAPPPPGSKSMVLGTLTQGQLKANQPPPPAPDAGTQTAAVAPAITLPGNTPEDKYNYAFGLLRQANYPEAEQALRAFVQQYPNDKLAGNAQYWLGESYYVRGNYNEAALAFAEGYQKYPTNVKAPQNLLKLAMSLTAMGRKGDACKAFDQLARQFPAAPADVKLRAGRERQNAGCPAA